MRKAQSRQRPGFTSQHHIEQGCSVSKTDSTEQVVSIGTRFSRLTVTGMAKGEAARWICVCDCGNEVRSASNPLRTGKTKSCGCLRTEISAARLKKSNTKHGQYGTPIYAAWRNMLARCLNPRVKEFKRYGGRGIVVCDRWIDSFDAFKSDMGERPDGFTIERRDVNGNYTPENCHWADQTAQQNNRRNNVRLEFKGECLTLAQWGRRTGIHWSTIRNRVAVGWSIEDALTKPTRSSHARKA